MVSPASKEQGIAAATKIFWDGTPFISCIKKASDSDLFISAKSRKSVTDESRVYLQFYLPCTLRVIKTEAVWSSKASTREIPDLTWSTTCEQSNHSDRVRDYNESLHLVDWASIRDAVLQTSSRSKTRGPNSRDDCSMVPRVTIISNGPG